MDGALVTFHFLRSSCLFLTRGQDTDSSTLRPFLGRTINEASGWIIAVLVFSFSPPTPLNFVLPPSPFHSTDHGVPPPFRTSLYSLLVCRYLFCCFVTASHHLSTSSLLTPHTSLSCSSSCPQELNSLARCQTSSTFSFHQVFYP